MNNFETTCILLPLRLEIRKIEAGQRMVKFGPVPNESDGKLRFSRPRIIESSEEYWIRWYPDDLAMHSPPKPITKAENEALEEFKEFCDKQHKYTLEIEPSQIRAKTKELVVFDWNQEFNDEGIEYVEKHLEIFNHFRKGSLDKEKTLLSEKFQNETLTQIQFSYQSQKDKKPEDRIVGLRLGWGKYYDFENPVLAWAWRRFIEKVGIIRARYLLSHHSAPVDFDDGEEKSNYYLKENLFDKGIQVIMPQRMKLFTLEDSNSPPTRLLSKDEEEEGIPVSPKLFITLQERDDSFWATDFGEALSKGMGCKITENIEQLKKASWLLAVGYSDKPSDNHQIFEEILKSYWNRGELSLTPQDAPTNNTEGENSQHTENPENFEAFFKEINNTTFINEFETIQNLDLSDTHSPSPQFFQNLSDSQLLSQVLGINPQFFTHIKTGGNREQLLAESMGRLIWRCCTKTAKNLFGKEHFDIESSDLEVKENEIKKLNRNWNHLEQIFTKFIRSRGPLPILSLGENPYGVLPIMDWKSWTPNSTFIQDDKSILKKIHSVSQAIEKEFIRLSEGVPTLSKSNESSEYNTLLEILRLHSVSKELWSKDIPNRAGNLHFNEDSKHIQGNLVNDPIESIAEPNPHYPGREYLEAIAYGNFSGHSDLNEISPIIHYKDPNDGRVAILHSLKYISAKPENFCILHKLLSEYIYSLPRAKALIALEDLRLAAQILLTEEIESMEILLMEIFDLLTFRLDAWIGAFATIRMYECLKVQSEKPSIAAYGWLEAPGNLEENTGEEFIQAPSLPQAATAALLRNGSLGKGAQDPSSPFHINLNSKRIRNGSLYLDKLRQGYSSGEILGYKLERMIHDAAESNSHIDDGDIYKLREVFRLPISRDSEAKDDHETAYSHLIDGKEFIDSFDEKKTLLRFSNEKLRAFEELKSTLQETTDAASDLSVAELVHQFMRGNQVRVGAWMDFIEGEEIPPDIEFSKSLRTGSTVETKIYLQVQDAPIGTSPYEMYDSPLFQFCRKLMPRFEEESIKAEVYKVDVESPILLEYSFLSLNLTPMDLVFGSEDELLFRVRCHIMNQWVNGEEEILGEFPELFEGNSPLNLLNVTILQEESSIFLKKGKDIRQILQRFEQKSPLSDPSPSAFSADGAISIDWEVMKNHLTDRVEALKNKLASEQLTKEEKAQFGFIEALAEDFLPSSRLDELEKSIETRISNLEAAVNFEGSNEEKVQYFIKFLSKAMGRPNAPFFIPYMVKNGSFSINFPDSAQIPLTDYEQVRTSVKQIHHAFAVQQEGGNHYEPKYFEANGDREIYYTLGNYEPGNSIIFLTLENWLEFIPNSEETSALAVRYISPKSQAPNAILIATPSTLDPNSSWDHEHLALALASTLNLMKIRMISTDQVINDNFFGRFLPLSYFFSPIPLFVNYERKLTYPIGSLPFAFQLDTDDSEQLPEDLARRQ